MARIAALINATPVVGFIGCAQAIPRVDTLDRLPELDMPTLVIVGERGRRHAAGHGARNCGGDSRRAPGGHPDASHLSNIEQADAFNRLLLDFLQA
ncbi:MAG: alpha/beta hydrolase [Rhodocyclaceae bacterium]|nr:alpha/beta hydrolase [Rhodocyclaceae bacterium]